MRTLGLLFCTLLTLFIFSCSDSTDGGDTVTLTLRLDSHDYSFNGPPEGWSARSHAPHVQYVDLVWRGEDLATAAVSDAVVALERDDGASLGEATSNADGLVVFEISEDRWPADATVSATAYKDGYVMHTRNGIPRPTTTDPQPLTMMRRWLDPLPTVQVSGTVQGYTGGYLFIHATIPYGGWYEEFAGTWSMNMPIGVPFDLIAMNPDHQSTSPSNFDYMNTFDRVARVSHTGVDADTVVDIDFEADAVETSTFTGSYPLPPRANSPLRSPDNIPVVATGGAGSYWSGLTGFASSMTRVGDEVRYSVTYVETPELGGNRSSYRVSTNRGDSVAYSHGLLEGAQPRLLDLPEWVDVPIDYEHSIDEPLGWELFDDQVRSYAWISASGRDPRWIVEVPEDSTQADFATPPSSVDLNALLGAAPMVRVGVQRRIDSTDGVFLLQSWGTQLPVDLGP